MQLRIPLSGPSPIHIIVPQGADEPRKGNGLVEFSLYLRDEMVRVIKQTTPQPNSAFHGALTLGLRYGMQNTVSIASDTYDSAIVAPLVNLGKDTDLLIADEFRASGINHVLAVSGLHVTIITIMFIGIFVMLKVSKKVYVPFIIFALVVFAIITGARPSTLRAVIMNSLFLLTWGYMSEGVRASALLGVPDRRLHHPAAEPRHGRGPLVHALLRRDPLAGHPHPALLRPLQEIQGQRFRRSDHPARGAHLRLRRALAAHHHAPLLVRLRPARRRALRPLALPDRASASRPCATTASPTSIPASPASSPRSSACRSA